MNTKKIDSKTLLIILLSIVSIIITVFTFLNIKETYDIKIKIAAEHPVMNQHKSEIAVLKSIQTQEADINAILLQFDDKIPAQPNEDKIISFMNEITGEAELLGITFYSRVPNEIAIEMPIGIIIKSDFFTMLKILINIVGASRLYTVNSVDITSADGAAASYSINLSAYYA